MQPPDALPATWQRLLALSGVVFSVLFVVGWFASGGDAPDYAAADQEWTEWADDNQWRSRIGAFAMLFVPRIVGTCSRFSFSAISSSDVRFPSIALIFFRHM
jgi:hypothetical protein